MRASIVGLAFSTAPRDADYVPVGHHAIGDNSSMPLDVALEALRAVLEDEAIRKDGHDLKFDAIVLARHGVTLRGLDTDTMLASYLLDATRSEHLLEDLALEYTSYKALTEEDVCGRGAKALSLANLPVEAALDYAGERADLVGQLAPVVRDLLDQGGAGGGLHVGRTAARAGPGRGRARRHPDRRPGAGRAVDAGRAGADAADRADFRDGRRRVQHQLARSSWRKSCSTSCSCRC